MGPDREVVIPPEAWRAYGFRPGDEAVFTPGSSTSGGFGISTPPLLVDTPLSALEEELLEIGRARFGEGRVNLPPELDVMDGARLLTGRGSRRALGFVARGPIYEEAMRHLELRVFEVEGEPEGDAPPSATV